VVSDIQASSPPHPWSGLGLQSTLLLAIVTSHRRGDGGQLVHQRGSNNSSSFLICLAFLFVCHTIYKSEFMVVPVLEWDWPYMDRLSLVFRKLGGQPFS
jgi:hypothetical protein